MKPPTFEELLKRATPGPYMHLPYDRGIYTRLNDGCRGMPLAYVPSETPEHQDNAELIVRLLAFANAGGVETLCAYLNEPSIDGRQIRVPLRQQLKDGLAILDGAAVPGSHYEEKK